MKAWVFQDGPDVPTVLMCRSYHCAISDRADADAEQSAPLLLMEQKAVNSAQHIFAPRANVCLICDLGVSSS